MPAIQFTHARCVRQRPNSMRSFVRCWVAIVCLAFGGSVFASVSIPIDLVNPGAEAGDLSGWLNLDGNFSAVQDPAVARNGDWYFASPPEPLGYRTHLDQLVDVRPYAGQIENIMLDVSLATDGGAAFIPPSPGPNGNFSFTANAFLTLFDVNQNSIPFSFGVFIEGSDQLNWVDRHMSLEWVNHAYPDLFKSVGYIEVHLYGEWWNETANTFLPSAIPAQYVTDAPTTMRFDDVQLSIVIPEPATLALLAFSTILAVRRRTKLLACAR